MKITYVEPSNLNIALKAPKPLVPESSINIHDPVGRQFGWQLIQDTTVPISKVLCTYQIHQTFSTLTTMISELCTLNPDLEFVSLASLTHNTFQLQLITIEPHIKDLLLTLVSFDPLIVCIQQDVLK